jgi:hypothetical protein
MSAEFDDDEPIREGSNLQAFLYTLRKAHIELEGVEAVRARFEKIRSRRHAREYFDEVMPRLIEERKRRRRK